MTLYGRFGHAAVVACGVAVALSGCGARPKAAMTLPSTPASSTAAASGALRTAAPTPARPPATTTPTRAAATKAARAQHQPLLVERLVGVDGAEQVVSVTDNGYGSSYATLTAFQRTPSGWRQVFGPWPARIGYNGFAPAGQKREGDGRTPTGSYGFSFFFGVQPSPGVRYAYRVATTTSWWDDDPASPRYNEWVDSRQADPGRNPESMHQVPAYDYGAVIAYNTTRRPGAGSAIFLHVSHNSATAGCVSIAQGQLLAVLHWLDPTQHPRIIMGPLSAVTR